jgi:hypothetical protein
MMGKLKNMKIKIAYLFDEIFYWDFLKGLDECIRVRNE